MPSAGVAVWAHKKENRTTKKKKKKKKRQNKKHAKQSNPTKIQRLLEHNKTKQKKKTIKKSKWKQRKPNQTNNQAANQQPKILFPLIFW